MATKKVSTTGGNGVIQGTVFYDADLNGQFAGDVGIGGVSVTLFVFDPTSSGKSQVGKPVSTNNDGTFAFPGLSDGDYLLEFQPTAVLNRPPRSPLTLQAGGPLQTNVTISPAGELQIRNFAYVTSPACISGLVKVKAPAPCGSTAVPTPVPFANVPIVLLRDGVPVATAVTDTGGGFDFDSLQPGNYSLGLPPQFQGHSLALVGGVLPLGFLGPGDSVDLTSQPIIYNGGSGTVRGRVVLQSGAGLPSIPLQLIDLGATPGATQATPTNDKGEYAFPNVTAGTYELVAPNPLQSGFGTQLQNVSGAQQQLTVTGDLSVPDIIYSSGVLVDTISSQFQQIGQSTATIASIIPTAMQQPASYQDPATANSGGLGFGQIVEASLTRVLGARPTNDPTKIVSLLTNSFVADSAGNGEIRYNWQPRGVTPTNGTTGSIVGAQATLYQQVQDIQTQVLRLLDVVEPIILDPDTNDIDAFKQDIVNTLASVVSETGRPGGAVPQRVDVLMLNISDDVDALRIKLGFGSTGALLLDMDVAESEQNLHNFDLLQSYLGSTGTLATIWSQYKTNILKFSGTQLTRLTWVSEAIPDTVQQIYAAMDAVGFGPADRRVATISGSDTLTIEQLLLWIDTAASVDWPNRLVAGSARKSEVQAVRREANNQRAAVGTLLTSLSTTILIGADRPRAVVEELKRELDQVATLAGNIAS